uniref:Seipin n=1 Tax=Cacopsylla melanoneura TaxID=428564 RepID=A0A8D8ZIW5_9HEMI
MNFVSGFIHRRTELVKQKSIKELQNVWEKIFHSSMLVLLSASVLWISIFLYIAFYYTYIPNISHVRPIHLQFNACEEHKGVCTYPSAHVQLTKRHQLLMIGQPYKILMYLEMPESPTNIDLGMFMTCAWLKDKSGDMISHSCRSAMLHYRSSLLITMKTLIQAPFLILGGHEEKQTLTLELFSDYEEDQNHPVTDIYVEVQSRFIHIYSASIHINAALSGLRYVMFTWPLLSALLGISSNLVFIVFICSVSWWQLYGPKEDLRSLFFYGRLRSLATDDENSFFYKEEEDEDENDVINLNNEDSSSGSENEIEDAADPDSKQISTLQTLQVVPDS